MNPRACALILDNQKTLLLIHRVKEGREYWVFPGGSVEAGESYEQAAIREVLEETTLIVGNPVFMLENVNAGRLERYFSFHEFSGEARLGNGPEMERTSKVNIYEPVWVSFAEFGIINVLPADIKLKVAALWESGKL